MSDYESDPLENPLNFLCMEPYVHDPMKKVSCQVDTQDKADSDSSESDSSSDNDRPSCATQNNDLRIDNLTWCECGKCHIMPSVEECVCCREIDPISVKLEEHQISCITQHEGYIANCLSRDVIETPIFEFLETYGPTDDNEPVNEIKLEPGEELMKKPLKVCSRDRRVRKGIISSSFLEFLDICKGKFKLGDQNVTLVLDEDGTEVDGDYWQALHPNTMVMILLGDEEWGPEKADAAASGNPGIKTKEKDEPGTPTQKKKIPKKNQEVASASTVTTLKVGWKRYISKEKKYVLKKTTSENPDAGPQDVTLPKSCDYEQTMDVLKSIFSGQEKGEEGNLTCYLADSNNEAISPNGFSLGTFSSKQSGPKTKIYLMTKAKTLLPDVPPDADRPPSSLGSNHRPSQSSEAIRSPGVSQAPGPNQTPGPNQAPGPNQTPDSSYFSATVTPRPPILVITEDSDTETAASSNKKGGFPPLFYLVLPHRDDLPKTPSKPPHPVTLY